VNYMVECCNRTEGVQSQILLNSIKCNVVHIFCVYYRTNEIQNNICSFDKLHIVIKAKYPLCLFK
jgi:hypothetical protein